MGLLNRLLDLFGGESGGRTSAERGRDDRSPSDGNDAKSGGHGSHWDTLVEGDEEIQMTVMQTLEEGEVIEAPSVEGRNVTGHRAGDGPVESVAVTADGELWTGYPVADGVAHEMHVDGLIPWANGVEVQLRGQLGPAEFNFFPTNFYAEDDEAFGGDRTVELAALAYACGPAEATTVTDEDGGSYSMEGMAAFLPLERGDVDDFSFRTTVKERTETTFDGRTVYQLRVPLFKPDEDADDVDIYLYAAEHVLGEYVPEVGDDIEGAFWLQGCVS